MVIASFVYVQLIILDLYVKHVILNKFEIIKILKLIFNNQDTNACSNSPCLNGATCQVTGTGSTYTCLCPAAYTGSNCQTCNYKNLIPN